MISVAIAHVETDEHRRAWVAAARRLLSPLPVQVAQARGRPCWPTNRDALRMLARRPEPFGLWLQDDWMPVPRLPATLKRIATHYPESPVSLFSMRRAVADQNRSIVETPDAIYGGTVLAPTSFWRAFLAWEAEHVNPAYPHDDRRVSLYCIEHSITVLTAQPSLLEHVGHSHSLQGHNNRGHVATRLAQSADEWQPGEHGKAPGTMPLKETRRDALL